MARKSEADRELEARAKERLKCFGCCNTTILECSNPKKPDDKCRFYDDCLYVTKLYNKGYDPDKPEEKGKNEPTFSFKDQNLDIQMEIESKIAEVKAAAAAPKRERGAKPAAEAPKPAAPPAPAAADPEDIDKVLEDLSAEGSKAQDLRSDELDALAGASDPVEPPPVEVEKAAEKAVNSAVEKSISDKKGVPAKAATLRTDDVKAMEYIIDYAAEAFSKALLQVLSGLGSVTVSVKPITVEGKPADEETPKEPEEKPEHRKRGRK